MIHYGNYPYGNITYTKVVRTYMLEGTEKNRMGMFDV